MADLPPPAIVVERPAAPRLDWQPLPSLPEGAGVAGAFVGVLGDDLFLAGGAAFPDGRTRVFTDRIHLLQATSGGSCAWVDGTSHALPRAVGYGAAIPWEDGLVLLGGLDAERCHAEVWHLGPAAAARPLAPLPVPLAHFAAARVGSTVVVAGGQESPTGPASGRAFLLDLARPESGWEELPSWPGAPRTAAVGVGLGNEFHLLGGRESRPGEPTRVLTDAFVFDLERRGWRGIADVGTPGETPAVVMAATAVALDDDRFVVLGGGAAGFLVERERLERELAAARAAGDAASETRARAGLEALPHPGFQRAVRLYDRRSGRWERLEDLPMADPPVTTTAVRWRDLVVLPGGEIRPRTRTESIWAARIAAEDG